MRTANYIVKFLAILLALVFAVSACNKPADPPGAQPNGDIGTQSLHGEQADDTSGYTARTKQTGEYFGTIVMLSLYDDYSVAANSVAFQDIWEQVKAILQEIENAVSVAIETSDIAAFNALPYGESVAISAHTAHILRIAKEAYQATDGLYDPAVYPLVDLWGFTPRFGDIHYTPTLAYDRERDGVGFTPPDEKYINAFVQLADFDGVVLSGSEEAGYTLEKRIPPVTVDGIAYQAKLDLGGIAKGYAVDVVVELLRSNGYEYGYFSCGSSSMGLMKGASEKSRENGTYRYNLGIRKPRLGNADGTAYLSVAVKDMFLSSSGDYDHCYTWNGDLYCHIIDPRTGYPINTPVDTAQGGIATATVMGANGTYAEVLSTALCVMGVDEAVKYINIHMKGYKAAIVIYDAQEEYYELITNLTPEEFTIDDTAYVLASTLDESGNVVYTGRMRASAHTGQP